MTANTPIEVVVSYEEGIFSYFETTRGGPLGNFSVEGPSTIAFVRKPGQTWTFQDFHLTMKATLGESTKGFWSAFNLTVATTEVVVDDTDATNAVSGPQTYEYGFTILVDGEFVKADPKLINRPSVSLH